jgi:hypothetical protein
VSSKVVPIGEGDVVVFSDFLQQARPLILRLFRQTEDQGRLGFLRAGVGFVLDPVGDHVEIGGVFFLVRLGTVLHGDKEFIGEGFHDQADLGFGGVISECRGERQGSGCGGKHSDSKKTSSEWQLHGFTPIL